MNTDTFFTRAQEFQDQRKAVMDEFEDAAVRLATARGSQYFDDEMAKAREKRDAALDKLRDQYGSALRASIDAMDAANRGRPMKAPTQDELALLQALKLRDDVSEQELEAAAHALKGVPVCLSALGEIARKQGFLRTNFLVFSEAPEMPVDAAAKTLEGLRAGVADFLATDEDPIARSYAAHWQTLNGKDPNAPPLPKRRMFTDKAGCFSELAGLSADALPSFCLAVDG